MKRETKYLTSFRQYLFLNETVWKCFVYKLPQIKFTLELNKLDNFKF